MSRRRSRMSGGSLLVLIAIVVVLVIFGGGIAAVLPMIEDALGVDLGEFAPINQTPGAGATTGPGPIPVEPGGGAGAFYAVYFTDPASFPDGTTSGGIEMNLIDLINNAQSTIDLAVFEFNLQDVADALIAAHQRGVQVRIVYDDEHTAEDPQMAQMINAGIPATPDERSAFMHNKFFVIDGYLVWTGSTNMTTNDMFLNNNNSIVIQSSELAANYTAEFEEMFAGQFGPTSPSATPNPIFTLNGVQIENYFGSEDVIIPRLAEVIGSAASTIHFMAFSYTDDTMGQAMLERGAAGVQVAGIFEVRGADTEFSECNALINAGHDIRLDGNPRTFHHKVVIIDGQIVITGSFNFSNNAAESNDENLLIINDAGLAALYEQEFNARMAEAQVPQAGGCELD